MKSKKLLLNAAMGCLLVGASGAAMAQDLVDCPGGFIVNQTVDSITLDGEACYIENVAVTGNVTVNNSPSLSFFDNKVGGNLVVVGGGIGHATVTANTILGTEGPNRVNFSQLSTVAGNVFEGELRVNNNLAGLVQANVIGGDLICTGNAELREFFNRVTGEDLCDEVQ